MADAPGWVTLTEGEEVVWQGRPTTYRYVGELLTALVLVVIGVAVWVVVGAGSVFGVTIPAAVPVGIIGAVIVLLGLAKAANTLLEWWSIRYLITSKEVYTKRGVVSRTVKNLPLDQVQNTSFTQSALGRLLSHGHVYIETAGSGRTEMAFRAVPNPGDVVEHITRQLDK